MNWWIILDTIWIPPKPPTKQAIMMKPAACGATPPLVRYRIELGSILYRAEYICAGLAAADR